MNDEKIKEMVIDALGESKDEDNWDEVVDMLESQIKNDTPTIEGLTKIIFICSELYQNNTRIFKVKFNQMVNDIKINKKMWEKCSTKDEVNRTYGAISFFNKMVKEKQGYDHAYKQASKEYKISEKILRSLIGSRNALKRNRLKL